VERLALFSIPLRGISGIETGPENDPPDALARRCVVYANVLSSTPEATPMKFVNVREFRLKLSELIDSQEEVVITRYGKPVSKLAPITPVTYADMAREMGEAFREAGVTKKAALDALEAFREAARAKRARRR
jgi:antitoxin (DNA-binding transcriptional repressor) of toxin-antitoxin stability system